MEEKQGAKANRTGKALEQKIVKLFRDKGFTVYKYLDFVKENIDTSCNYIVENVPYINAYGQTSKTEFVMHYNGKDTRIEAKWQEVAGSVDEKYIFMFYNAVFHYPEKDVIFVVDGNGYRPGARKWIEDSIKENRFNYKEKGKTIQLMNVNEFVKYCNNNLK